MKQRTQQSSAMIFDENEGTTASDEDQGKAIDGEIITKRIKVIFSGCKIKLDCNEISLINKYGDKFEPFEYNGELYAPAALLARALGFLHTWDDTRSVLNIITGIKCRM